MISTLFHRLFPCRFNDAQCVNTPFGCRCGKGGSKKAERRADDLARQQVAQAATTQQAVQAATAPTPQEQARIGATFGLESRQLPVLESRARALPEELIRQIGPEASAYLDLISKRLGMTPEELFGGTSQTASDLQRAIGQRLQTPPTIPFEDVFQPEFQLLKQNVYNESARRGFGPGSGLEIEQLGRGGVDLAIRQAALRQQNAQMNAQLRQQSLADAANLVGSQYGLGQEARQAAGGMTEFGAGLSQQARAELANYLANQQQLSEAARGRQTQGVVQSYAAAEPFQGRAGQFQSASLEALNQRMQQSRQDTQELAKALAVVAAAPFTGGVSLAALPAIGASGSTGGVSRLLSAQQQANAAGASQFGGPPLSYGGQVAPPYQQYPSPFPRRRNWWEASS